MSAGSHSENGAFIHVVDDDEAMRDALCVLLETRGFKVRAYESATDFLAVAADAEAGCVITDVQMPQMSGIEMLHELRRHARSYPAIVLCGRPTPGLEASARAEGAAAFFGKPFDPADLAAAVQAALKAAA